MAAGAMSGFSASEKNTNVRAAPSPSPDGQKVSEAKAAEKAAAEKSADDANN